MSFFHSYNGNKKRGILVSPLKARVVGYVFLIIAIVLFLLRLSVQKYIQVCSWIGMAIFFIAMVILFIFLRCPSCRRFLPLQDSLGVKSCPYCGKELK